MMHRVHRHSNCQLEALQRSGKKCEPPDTITMTTCDSSSTSPSLSSSHDDHSGNSFSHQLRSSSPPQQQQLPSLLASTPTPLVRSNRANNFTAATKALPLRPAVSLVSAFADDAMPAFTGSGAATQALQQSKYDANVARIQELERENALLKAKQVEIQAAKELYLKVFEDFPALIWRSGLDKMCNYFNRTWLEWTGKTMEQEMGIGWVSGVHPDDFDQCLKIYTTAFDARQAFCMEYRLMDKYEQYRWIRDHGRPFYDLDDTFLGYIGSCYDITENKNNEHRLTTLNKTRDRLFDLVTHDLRHPVATTVGLTEFLQEYHATLNGDELRELSVQMHSDSRRTLELVDQLLKWTCRTTTATSAFDQKQSVGPGCGGGGFTSSFKPKPIMSQELFRQVVSQVNLCAKFKKIRVKASGGCSGGGNPCGGTEMMMMDTMTTADKDPMDYERKDDDDSNVMLVVDKDMILTVLHNLVMNSIKFTRPGGFIQLKAQKLDQETVLLSVVDNGIGMSDEVSRSLFDAPSAAPPQRGTGNELGSGMGTVLCKDFVERHGGGIWVAQSAPDHGTCIQMTLPATMAQLKQLQEKEEPKHIYYKLGVA